MNFTLNLKVDDGDPDDVAAAIAEALHYVSQDVLRQFVGEPITAEGIYNYNPRARVGSWSIQP